MEYIYETLLTTQVFQASSDRQAKGRVRLLRDRKYYGRLSRGGKVIFINSPGLSKGMPGETLGFFIGILIFSLTFVFFFTR